MATEQRDDEEFSLDLPAAVDGWLADHAERRETSRAAVCREFLTVAQQLEVENELTEPAATQALTDLEDRLDDQRSEYVDLIEDVRERVIQVKREVDEKADRSHDHETYADEDRVAALASEVDQLETALEDGFDEFEEILEYVLDELEELEDRSVALARAILELKDARAVVETRGQSRARADALQLAANRLNVRTAVCEACDSSVDIALLNRPRCPHCAEPFADVEQRTSILRSHRLRTGEPPALPSGHVVDAEYDETFATISDVIDEVDRESVEPRQPKEVESDD